MASRVISIHVGNRWPWISFFVPGGYAPSPERQLRRFDGTLSLARGSPAKDLPLNRGENGFHPVPIEFHSPRSMRKCIAVMEIWSIRMDEPKR